VVQVFQDLETLFHDGVALVSLDVGNEAHAAGVMFLGSVVQTVLLQLRDFGGMGHA
jgi:hypothetical protein